jgi:hypothetical protein
MDVKQPLSVISKFLLATSISLLIHGCGGGGGGGGGGDGDSQTTNSTPPSTTDNIQGQAILGPVIGATVNLYQLDNINSSICSTETLISSNIEAAGTITLPASCPEFNDDDLYLVTVAGGEDIDADDDGNIDDVYTNVEGVVRAIISGQQILEGNWKVTALSEAIYQAVQYSISSGDMDYIAAELKRIAPLYLTEDITGDGIIDTSDLIAWHPRRNSDSIINADRILSLITDIHAGLNRSISAQTTTIGELNLFDLGIRVNELIVQGSTAYIATSTSLVVADVSDPKNIVIQSSVASAFITDIDVKNNIVALALGNSGIQLVDISNPLNPAVTGLISGNFDLVTWTDKGLVGLNAENGTQQGSTIYSINTSNLAKPVVVDSLGIKGIYFKPRSNYDEYSHKLKSDGNFIYASLANLEKLKAEIYIIDVSEPGKMALSTTISTNQFAGIISDFIISEQQLYMIVMPQFGIPSISADASIQATDLSNPYKPVNLGQTPATQLNGVTSIEIFNNGIYALVNDKVIAYALPTFEQLFTVSLPDENNFDIIIRNDIAYIQSDDNIISVNVRPISPTIDVQGYALTGRIVNAAVSIHSVSDLLGDAICSMESQDSAEFENAGLITIPIDCISKPGFYRVTVQGGLNIDWDNDGVRDTTPVAVDGAMHSYFSSFELAQNWSINPLSEVIYQLIDPIVKDGHIDIAIDQADQYAQLILSNDIDGDGKINRSDIFSWAPNYSYESYLLIANPDDWLANIIDGITNDFPLDTYLSLVTNNVKFLAIDDLQLYFPDGEISLATSSSELFIIDDKSEDNIRILSRLSISDIKDISVSDNIAYLARGDLGLAIIDLSDPTTPLELDGFSGGSFEAVEAATPFLYSVGKNNSSQSHQTTGIEFNFADFSLWGINPTNAPVLLTRVNYDGGIETEPEYFNKPKIILNDSYIYLTLVNFLNKPNFELGEDVYVMQFQAPFTVTPVNQLNIMLQSDLGGLIRSSGTYQDSLIAVMQAPSGLSSIGKLASIDITNPSTSTFSIDDLQNIESGTVFLNDQFYQLDYSNISSLSVENLTQQWATPYPAGFSVLDLKAADDDYLYFKASNNGNFSITSILKIPVPVL